MIVVASVVLGAVFVVSGGHEDRGAECSGVPSPPTSACRVRWQGSCLPGAGGGRAAGRSDRSALAAAVAAVLLVAFTVLLVVRLPQGRRPPCACFGALTTKPIGWGNVVRNAIFLALAVSSPRLTRRHLVL